MSYEDEYNEGWDEGYQSGLDAGEEERASLRDELTEVKRQLASLERTHAGDHRGFIESRRTILAQRDELQAQLAEARKFIGGKG